jgi:2-dehydro-3-deoxyphosphogluconate aldolase/(4S)-4-hydroxy-2-oxoglutarate aldolase
VIEDPLQTILADRVVVVVRARAIPDVVALVDALEAGGIRAIELTFTTPGVGSLLEAVFRERPNAVVGAGTVLTAEQARLAIDSGARFLVTPGLIPEVAEFATNAGVPFMLGALTPTEVIRAVALGASAVKIFPATTVGAQFFGQLRGPLPGVGLIASGGIDENNAAEFLRAGAGAVTAGSSVVSASDVESGDWSSIRLRAGQFVASLS